MGLRPASEQALHAQDETAPASGPRRLCRLLPGERHKRKQTWSPENEGSRWRAFEYDELARRDKLNLDLLWLRDALEDSENLPEPEVLAAEIVEDLHSALEAFQAIARELEPSGDTA